MCTKPKTAWQRLSGGPLTQYPTHPDSIEQKLTCKKCPECVKDYYTSWATRGHRELSRWNSSVFITLTYDDDHLPKDKSLDKTHVQLFIKRVKKYFKSTKSNPIRQTYCGEYGSKTLRPHYHAVLYNCDFPDKNPHYVTSNGHQVYQSKILSQLWGQGFAEFGYATAGSIAYITKYILKKKTRAERRDPLLHEINGCIYEVKHEFIEHSRNPGIGAHLRGSHTLNKGYLYVDGLKKKIPSYYLEDLRKNDPEKYDKIQNLKFDFMETKEKESHARLQQKENAQKKLTDTKRKM